MNNIVVGFILYLFGIVCLIIACVAKKMKFKDPKNELPTIRAFVFLGILLLIIGALLWTGLATLFPEAK